MDGVNVRSVTFAALSMLPSRWRIDFTADPHQVHSLIAAAISECRKHNPAGDIFPEEAKMMARCAVQQLGDAGFHILRSAPDKDDAPEVQWAHQQKVLLMGELLDKLNAANTSGKGRPENAHRATEDAFTDDFFSLSETVHTAGKKLNLPGMPLHVVSKWTRQAPLQALGVAFLVGVILARPKR
jgi:hypothetical protein